MNGWPTCVGNCQPVKTSLMSLFPGSLLLCYTVKPIHIIAPIWMNKGSHTSFGVMWGKRLWFEWPFKASLITSTTALETDKSIGRSTWSQHNNSENADFSSPTYHQHYPILETDSKSIGRSNVNAWPWKSHLSSQHWVHVSQHRIGLDYWQVHKWKGQKAAQSLGGSRYPKS